MRVKKNPEQAASAPDADTPRRRLGVAERERQIIEGAIAFFSQHGLGGQLRDLAKSIGVTHALLYHYFPTKQALIDRVYVELFEGRWRSSWDALLDDSQTSPEDKLVAFYADYLNNTLSREFVRVLVFSGLTDHTITDRFFAMLRQRLFPRLIRETRRFRGSSSRAKVSEREHELLMGLHGGFFYVSIRRWIYGQAVHGDSAPGELDMALVRDRVRGYLVASRELFPAAVPTGAAPSTSTQKTARQAAVTPRTKGSLPAASPPAAVKRPRSAP